jgi:hypothetical protein
MEENKQSNSKPTLKASQPDALDYIGKVLLIMCLTFIGVEILLYFFGPIEIPQ